MATYGKEGQELAQHLSTLTGCKFNVVAGENGDMIPSLEGVFSDRRMAQESHIFLKKLSKQCGFLIHMDVDKDHPDEIEESKTSTFYEHKPNIIPASDGFYHVIISFPAEDSFLKFMVYINRDFLEVNSLSIDYRAVMNMCEKLNFIQSESLAGWIAPPTKGWVVYGDQHYTPNIHIHFVKPHLRLYFTGQAASTDGEEGNSILQKILLQLIDLGFYSARHGQITNIQGQPSPDYISLMPTNADLADLFHSIAKGDRLAVPMDGLTRLDQDIRYAYGKHGGILFLPPESVFLKNLMQFIAQLR
ncbi:MAG: hypothetical protein IPP74_00615 [Alphaproteobacteria bacterium]|nr:hypothetical protein [Alphaproteobacteria bacterium]